MIIFLYDSIFMSSFFVNIYYSCEIRRTLYQISPALSWVRWGLKLEFILLQVQPCQYRPMYRSANCSAYDMLPEGDEGALKLAVATIGPISIAIDALQPKFLFYSGGRGLKAEAGIYLNLHICTSPAGMHDLLFCVFRGVRRSDLFAAREPCCVGCWLRHAERTRLLAGEEQVRCGQQTHKHMQTDPERWTPLRPQTKDIQSQSRDKENIHIDSFLLHGFSDTIT